LAKNGCDIVRVTVNNQEAALAVPELVAQSPVPLVADIHFDYRLAIMALEGGIAKLRINPGNIGGEAHVAALADCLKRHHVPVRIGVNSGSIERPILEKYGGVTPQGMVDSALGHARMLEKRGFDDIVLSLKGTQVPQTVEAYQLASKACDYPLHVGFTHVGTRERGHGKNRRRRRGIAACRRGRYAARVADRQPAAGGHAGQGNSARGGAAQSGRNGDLLPHLRQGEL
jgi:(E)-4-hydroxy-3-methylbut-2-enyl-diphosphate synthase